MEFFLLLVQDLCHAGVEWQSRESDNHYPDGKGRPIVGCLCLHFIRTRTFRLQSFVNGQCHSTNACLKTCRATHVADYRISVQVSEVDSFIKKLAKEDRVRRLPAELHRRLQTLVKNHRG